jgi:hypothetical protein
LTLLERGASFFWRKNPKKNPQAQKPALAGRKIKVQRTGTLFWTRKRVSPTPKSKGLKAYFERASAR